MTRFPPPTEQQLREAYDRTQLARMGITFEAALQDRAITGSLKKPHFIDVNKCIGCGACKSVCKFDAVTVQN